MRNNGTRGGLNRPYNTRLCLKHTPRAIIACTALPSSLLIDHVRRQEEMVSIYTEVLVYINSFAHSEGLYRESVGQGLCIGHKQLFCTK